MAALAWLVPPAVLDVVDDSGVDSVLLGTGTAGLQLLGGQLWVSDMFTGAALVLAVAFAALGHKQRLRGLK